MPKEDCSKCGNPNDRLPQRYCKLCHAAYARENRKPYSALTDEQRKKNNCRSYAQVYLRRGKIKPESCVKCGDSHAEMHHEDYDKPLDVIWLCRSCHLAHHKI